MAKKFKHAQTDYTLQMLPQNRIEVFKDVFKLQWGKLIICGLILFVCLLPFFVSAIISDLYEIMLQAQFLEGSITANDLSAAWMGFCNTRGIIEIIAYIIVALGLAAVTRIVRQLAWGENVLLRLDIVKGIKQNTVQFIIMGLIAGIIRFGCTFFINNFVASDGFPYVGVIISVLMVVLCVPVALLMSVSIPVYGNKFRQNIRVCFTVYLKHPFKIIGTAILCLLIYIPQSLPLFGAAMFYVHLAFRIIAPLIGGIIYLIWFLFAMSQFDIVINKKHFPSLIDRGISGKTTDAHQSAEITDSKDAT